MTIPRPPVLRVLLVATTILMAFACGPSDAEPANDDDESDDASATPPANANDGSSYACCINGQGHLCSDQSSFDRCSGAFDFAACMEGCGPADFTCHDGCITQQENVQHDPSACTPDPSGCRPKDNDDDDCEGVARPCSLSLDCCGDLVCVDKFGNGDKTCDWP